MIKNIKNIPSDLINDVEPHTTKKGEVIYINKSWNHCYIGDYETTLHFGSNLIYGYTSHNRFTSMREAKHGELETVLDLLSNKSVDGEIFCDAYKGQYKRRKKAVEKLGYTVIRDNSENVEQDHDRVTFIIKKTA